MITELKNLKVGDRVKFVHPHEVFASLFGLEGTIVGYNKHGWGDREEKHTVSVEWDNGRGMVGEVAMLEKI